MTSPRDGAERELGRVLTRLAALGPSRLSREGDDGAPAPVDLVRPVLQHLADAAAGLEGRGPGGLPAVPVLAERALGDQLAVLGRDLLDAAGPDDDAALRAAADALTALRRAL